VNRELMAVYRVWSFLYLSGYRALPAVAFLVAIALAADTSDGGNRELMAVYWKRVFFNGLSPFPGIRDAEG